MAGRRAIAPVPILLSIQSSDDLLKGIEVSQMGTSVSEESDTDLAHRGGTLVLLFRCSYDTLQP